MDLETTSNSFNLGDILFTVVSIGFLILLVVLVVLLIRASNNRKKRLDRIEEKLDKLNDHT